MEYNRKTMGEGYLLQVAASIFIGRISIYEEEIQ